jgi:hypothetical protein
MLEVIDCDLFLQETEKIEAAIKEANLKSNVIPFSPGSSVVIPPIQR